MPLSHTPEVRDNVKLSIRLTENAVTVRVAKQMIYVHSRAHLFPTHGPHTSHGVHRDGATGFILVA